MPAPTKSLNPAVIRLAHPLAFSAYLQNIGAPSDSYFRRQGLPTLCKDANVFVPLKMAWGVFSDAALREDRDIGWKVGQFSGDNGLNSGLLKKLDNSPTLYLALQKLIRLINSEASHLKLGLLEFAQRVLLFTHYPGMREQSGYLVSQTYQLEVLIDVIRHFVGATWTPASIGVEAGRFPELLRNRYPSTELKSNQPFGYIAIQRSALHLNLSTSHEVAGNGAPIVQIDKLNFADTLGLLLEPYLSLGYPSRRFAASLTDHSPRTLSRRLADCGKGYQSVVDEARFKKACHLIKNSDRSITEVARAVGFNDQANFSRQFKRVGGLSPMHFRKLKPTDHEGIPHN